MSPNSWNLRRFIWNPVAVTLSVSVIVVAAVVVGAGGDPLELARIGTRFSQGDPDGTAGYDGQFVYYIARDPTPSEVAQYLDVPAYRYQRILLPFLGGALSFGNQRVLPWILALVGILSHAAGTWAVTELLKGWRVRRWYALVYGLWVGFLLAIRLLLPEPLAYGLVAGAILALDRDRPILGWLLLSLAVFAKEVTFLFTLAVLLYYLYQREWRSVVGLSLLAILPFAQFQLWLWGTFGQPGIGSGGDMATPFEIIPFMGLLRIGNYSVVYLLAMLVVFVPAVLWPAMWGLWRSARKWLSGDRNMIILVLFLNALVIPFLPFSTFRETGGTLRFACGLVLAVVLFTAYYRMRKALNYNLFWIVLNVFLFKS